MRITVFEGVAAQPLEHCGLLPAGHASLGAVNRLSGRTTLLVRKPSLTRARRVGLLLVLVALLAPVTASSAGATKRQVPFGFFGTTLPGPLEYAPVSDATLDQQMALMARSGVETLRIGSDWNTLEPARGVYNWTRLDRWVTAAARHRISILENVYGSPFWASGHVSEWWAPRNPSTYAELMRKLVLRYGPRGAFWTQHPSLPRVPIREWQVWNEQTASFFWRPVPWARPYTRLLRAAYVAIHRADRGAKVVAGSLVGAPEAPWNSIRDLYRAGAKRYFDIISVHPFTNNPHSVSDTVHRTLEIVQRVRAVMDQHGDGGKPVILTEVTWPAALRRVPKAALLGFETTPRGQAERLRAVFSQIARHWRKLRITQVFWFDWDSEYTPQGNYSNLVFRYSGLTRFTNGVVTALPILKTYARVAAQYEGCPKGTDAKRCR